MNKEERKVILIGIDGMDYQTLQRLATPNFDRLYTSELFTGGELNTETEQQTYSGPSWATILTGVWANQHQIIKNDKNLKSATPSLFDRINQVYPQAKLISVIRWDTIYDNLYSDISFAQHKIVIKEHDFKAVEKFIELLKNKPDFAFLHLDDVDHAGHDFGFSKEYDQSIIDADLMLGKIIDVIENNKQVNEKYLIIVTTDHGRNNSGKEHGGQSNSEKITFYATNNDFYHRKKTLQITGAIPQTYIANSILDYLHVTPLK
ncbi:MAG: alkaline phosphatase family protein [Colwellia sp.]|nr:alkaline phosphatase family protein [Colwellia sp.]